METGAHIRLVFARAAKEIERVDRASIADTGLNVTDFAILEALLHKGPLPVNAIGRKVLLTSGSMTAAAQRLMAKGYVQRKQDLSDRRVFNLELTPAGRRLIEAAYATHARNLEDLFRCLSAAQRRQIVKLLKTIGRHARQLASD